MPKGFECMNEDEDARVEKIGHSTDIQKHRKSNEKLCLGQISGIQMARPLQRDVHQTLRTAQKDRRQPTRIARDVRRLVR